ncbi:unnamed protein product [Linum tenue]|uniref:Uncharacterized protein n=1 Tax=Linum tenue TaxID=586396 RepID=A0AAV0LG44_9ROSI|nr:unnamed protein product [Linum tenue]
MYGLRDRIFKKYKDLNQRMNHPPPQISPSIWREMEMSEKNKGNREKSELAATGGSAPLAKYRLEEIKQTRKEPDPIEMFRRFHVKDKNWVSSKAKTLHDGMIQAEAEKVSQGEEPNKFAIYQEVIGPQRPKRVLGMGHGVSSVDVFGPPSSQGSQGCRKRCQEDRTKERGKNDEKMKKLEDEIVDVRNAVPHIVESVL